MTLTMAWVRAQNNVEELVVASDSRLRGGNAWDAAPKILPLQRDDAVLAFAGATEFAYPMMLQTANAVISYARTGSRAQSLDDLRGHVVRVMNGMLQEMSDPTDAFAAFPDAVFVLAGYSWKYGRWRIWTLYFDTGIKRFTFRPASSWRGGHDRKFLALVGDSVPVARSRLIEILRAKRRLSSGGFDWEPLQVLTSMINDGRFPSIGGPPQVVKVYKYLRVVPFAVPWPRSDGSPGVSFMGRRLLDYEALDTVPLLPIDPTTGASR